MSTIQLLIVSESLVEKYEQKSQEIEIFFSHCHQAKEIEQQFGDTGTLPIF
ncbi:hypothetical protein GCM10011418_16150 [Sphingobacterium alkalisoli]|nr:hypothetical protein GCM10011418_16150 [Sphingobacterium alkalisoli]